MQAWVFSRGGHTCDSSRTHSVEAGSPSHRWGHREPWKHLSQRVVWLCKVVATLPSRPLRVATPGRQPLSPQSLGIIFESTSPPPPLE